ncbi:hypothetical protein KFL_008720020 [Klebsormidium nitens]|uniref:Reverse transcriptase/retrotransposon-derived protein RNase H-like domain-containing protein n=1 Tax=Klebsormidium nitens TaxID=105231 RepID=A0A1Y1IT89_KLENI|nr:hypothetical protein KFL_008720020 [Klebsormidium nitens]|eukprot:GAQ91867.1 hypothetical protein KFL_008720020 [Klebsormidium nitens]
MASTEALIRMGIKIKQLHCCESDHTARAVAMARLKTLSGIFPNLSAESAFENCFGLLPQDVKLINQSHIIGLGPLDLVVCGFPCQGFSGASGTAKGLRDPRTAALSTWFGWYTGSFATKETVSRASCGPTRGEMIEPTVAEREGAMGFMRGTTVNSAASPNEGKEDSPAAAKVAQGRPPPDPEPDVEYLGHRVVPGGTAPMQVKVEAIVMMRSPTEVPELRAVLGTFNYYRKFVEHYSTIAAPLNNLLRNDVAWGWSEACQQAFETLKIRFTEAPILRRPDHKRPFELHTDWSGVGLGAVLVQRDDQGLITYASRSNNKTERNYSRYQGECLAAVLRVSYFRSHLYGRHFKLPTDNEPLKWLMTNEKLIGMHARWAHILSEYDFKIEHRAGLKSEDADGLSRKPPAR